MSIQLPAAPANFYTPSLQTLKDALEARNGMLSGQIVILKGIPDNIEIAWNDVGVGNNTVRNTNRGNLVIGHAPITSISAILKGDIESGGEPGYKLQFEATPKVPIYIDGSGISSASMLGLALVIGHDLFASGSDDSLKYLLKSENIFVKDGGLINLPQFEINIEYGTED